MTMSRSLVNPLYVLLGANYFFYLLFDVICVCRRVQCFDDKSTVCFFHSSVFTILLRTKEQDPFLMLIRVESF